MVKKADVGTFGSVVLYHVLLEKKMSISRNIDSCAKLDLRKDSGPTSQVISD